MSEKDFYAILDVTKTATDDELKKAYKKKALKYHPDRVAQDKESQESAKLKFQEISEAYSVLSDKDKRGLYDRYGMAGLSPQTRSPFSHSPGAGDFPFRFGQRGGDAFSFFEEVFGSSFREFSRRKRKLADTNVSLNMTLEELYNGKKGDFSVYVDTWEGGWKNSMKKTIRVEVPAGLKNGTKLRYEGMGSERPGFETGDIVFTLCVLKHDRFTLSGKDLEMNLAVSLDEYLSETFRRAIKGIDGKTYDTTFENLYTTDGSEVLRGLGMRDTNGLCGNLVVKFVVKYPVTLSNRQIEQLQTIL
nr:curved DNA-binding protein, putative [Entamoeba invadens]